MRAARRPAAAAGARLLAHAACARAAPGGDAVAASARAAASAGVMHSPLLLPAAGLPPRAGAPPAWRFGAAPLLQPLQQPRRFVAASAARERGAQAPNAAPTCDVLAAPPSFATHDEELYDTTPQAELLGRVANGFHMGASASQLLARCVCVKRARERLVCVRVSPFAKTVSRTPLACVSSTSAAPLTHHGRRAARRCAQWRRGCGDGRAPI
jgi:hypothetical protein